MKNTIAPLVEVRGPELDAARRVAARAASETGLPFVALSTDQNGWAVYSFETGYRKRLAYALAFEASLKAGSLLPYKERLPALISGSLADLISACPAVDERLAFSVYLNLTGYLDQAVHEQELGKPAHWLPGPLRDATEKRAWLWDRLREAARLRGQSLTNEGQRAIEILLQEAAMPIEDHAHLPRIWSVIASEQTYQAG